MDLRPAWGHISKLQASLCYVVCPCFKKKKVQKNKERTSWFFGIKSGYKCIACFRLYIIFWVCLTECFSHDSTDSRSSGTDRDLQGHECDLHSGVTTGPE